MEKDLTRGNVIRTMLLFAAPMILGNLLQQCYNIADSLIVGRFLGPDALAAAAVLNILLDLLFVAFFSWGIKGAAAATVLAQAISGAGKQFWKWGNGGLCGSSEN